MAKAAILKNLNSLISGQRFDPSPRNFARWLSLALLILLTVKISKF